MARICEKDHELKESKTALTPQEMVRQYHIKLLFNPEAASWVSRVEVHT